MRETVVATMRPRGWSDSAVRLTSGIATTRPAVGGMTGRSGGGLLEAQMLPRAHVVRDVGVRDALQSGGAQDDHVIEAFAPNRPDDSDARFRSLRLPMIPAGAL
jgi:hypothetical protein